MNYDDDDDQDIYVYQDPNDVKEEEEEVERVEEVAAGILIKQSLWIERKFEREKTLIIYFALISYSGIDYRRN
jgi:hypothetical protein